ncbi:MAG: HIRAN domain-containing protein [Anaerovoracaceae bacterium]|jgi:hypothetical protein
MANEIIDAETKLAALITENKLGEVIKPLKKEIHLFDTYVAGTSYLEDPTVLEEVVIGDTLILRREDNKFDENAILVLTEDNRKLGYIPEKDNIVFSRLMDAGKLLIAKIAKVEQRGKFTLISIGIYLVDF